MWNPIGFQGGILVRQVLGSLLDHYTVQVNLTPNHSTHVLSFFFFRSTYVFDFGPHELKASKIFASQYGELAEFVRIFTGKGGSRQNPLFCSVINK
jgi:hypothetical protein